jgi:arylsulfatase A-like enzyme
MKKHINATFFVVILVCSLTIIYFTFFANHNEVALKSDFNIVLITIDALRADHLSCYGYNRNTSPNIDRIAEKGIIFKNATATSSWTAPSMASLFTSVYPINHGVVHGMGYKKDETIYTQEVFSDELTTLAELLKEHGYTTIGVASNLHLSEKFGFARGFDSFGCLPFVPADSVNRIICRLESEIKNFDKYFLWIHYIDPHYPYSPRKPWINHYLPEESTLQISNLSDLSPMDLMIFNNKLKKDNRELSKQTITMLKKNLLARYDSEINYVDSYIGELIQIFDQDDNTIIIITSDHGEEFFEYDYVGHGNNLHHETTHIPLIIKLPSSYKKGIVEKNISLVDVMPTILHTLNITAPDQTLGQSFWENKEPLFWLKKMLLRKESSEYKFAELDNWYTFKSIITPEWKYIYDYKDNTEQLYNIKSDPMELNNLADKKAKQCNKLREQLFKWVSDSKKYPTIKQARKLSPEEKEKLKELGYIQ